MNTREKAGQDKGALVKELKEKLDWYTLYASDEEYDEKAVEAILYLLDSLEPLDKGVVLQPDEAWAQFQGIMAGKLEVQEEANMPGMVEKSEKLVVQEEANIPGRVEKPEMLERPRKAKQSGMRRNPGMVGMAEKSEETELSEELGIETGQKILQMSWQDGEGAINIPTQPKAVGRLGRFVSHHKYIVAAAIGFLILSVVGGGQAGASRDTGFFHWLKHDDTGTQMVTSPEDLDGEADMKEIYKKYDREGVPEWAQEWLKIDDEFEMPENYEWECFEVEELRNFHKIVSHYIDKTVEQEILLGLVMYYDKISYNRERIAGYDYVDSYEAEQKQIHVYERMEETGTKCYVVYFYEGNCQYFIQGHDNLDELKGLITQYWLYVKNNLEKNKVFCNKMSSQAIYK